MAMHSSVGFHTRLYGQNSVKVVGGSFGGSLDIDTANRLIRNHGFTVTVKQSGHPVFVDKEGREVTLYFAVNPRNTEIGKAALALDRKARELQERQEEIKRQEVETLLDGMTMEEALKRLSQKI